jgi:hypothetical protein
VSESSDPAAVAVALAEIRGEIATGFARTDGQLALLVQRGNQTDQKLSDHESRLDSLERARWPLPSLAAIVSVAALGVAAYEAMH